MTRSVLPSVLFGLVVGCSGPKHADNTAPAATQPAPTSTQASDDASRIPTPPTEGSGPADVPHGSRIAPSREVAQATRDAGIGGGGDRTTPGRDAGTGGAGDAGVGGRDAGGGGGGGDAGAAPSRPGPGTGPTTPAPGTGAPRTPGNPGPTGPTTPGAPPTTPGTAPR
ncbi:MAG TPA: hypothetical protein VK427_03050 [Kofleriaceae bacterium]|nr:hypothetical protein [Kofleriaceae bacterium]